MRDAEPWNTIEFDDLGRAEPSASQIDYKKHGSDANIGQNDSPPLLLLKEGRSRIEMVCPSGIVFLSGNVEHYKSPASCDQTVQLGQ